MKLRNPAKSRNTSRRRGWILAEKVVLRSTSSLTPFPGNARRHPESQLAALRKNIRRGWTNPILIDEENIILAGHGRLEAAKRLGIGEVPTLTITGLNDSEKRALVIADNRLAELAAWDFESLRQQFKHLVKIDFDVELTGFSTGEVDLILDSSLGSQSTQESAETLDVELESQAVSRSGDLWTCGRHLMVCGDALQPGSYRTLLDSSTADLVLTDPPYNVRIDGHATGNGKIRHREFKMASGEMSEAAFTKFLDDFMDHAIAHSRAGSIHYIFMDWRHLPELLSAARPQYSEWKNLLVWNKTNAGQGSFYRSKHELIAVFQNGEGRPTNNFGLGAKGRYRTNVLDYPGVNSMHPARKGELALHPTVKPIALVADLIRDCSRRNEIVLDPFGGSGTTLLAAERTGRIARLIELDPLYVDLAIRRWEKTTGRPARLHSTGATFAETAAAHLGPPVECSASPARYVNNVNEGGEP